MDLTRTIVIGNSGSGKSWLAQRIARSHAATLVDLDLIHWLPGGFDQPRDRDDAMRLVKRAAGRDRWVIEGIYGWLVEGILADATALVWLRVEPADCVAAIRQRGIRRGGSEASLAALLQWAATYRSRQGSSAYAAHERIFDEFRRDRLCLSSRDEVTAFAASLADSRQA
ncbi:P-loop NTPase family protein [Burkholderia ubonensis]|uniref:Adenylate kinase n=1 Tax=Burkholderia ubonensis subsp. mesacidophila TaxID=265293 RepID=A0A2A4FPN1_9BURK|nr:adenylate kinase [Burkholderia ubonensis]PCE34386.1 adenylate kinase [Burkholderia ubonensis subsp. mesacidophila]